MTEAVAAFIGKIRGFYANLDAKLLLETENRLPNPEQAPPELASESLDEDLVQLNDYDNSDTPFLQSTFSKNPAALYLIHFWPLNRRDPDWVGAKEELGSPDFSIFLPGDFNLDSLMRNFYIPLIIGFLKMDENSNFLADVQDRWTNIVLTYNSKLKSDTQNLAMTSRRVDEVFSSGDISDRNFSYAATYLLLEIIKYLNENQQSNERFAQIVRNPIVYQAARVLYAYTIAVREDHLQKTKRIAEQKADAEMIVNHLIHFKDPHPEPGQGSIRPVSREEIGELPDVSNQKIPIKQKYASIGNLLPLKPSESEPVPKVLTIQKRYLHRWQLVNYFLSSLDAEALRVGDKLAGQWSHTGIPRNKEIDLPKDFVAPEFVELLEYLHNLRKVAKEPEVFAQYFFPRPDDAAEVQFLSRLRRNGIEIKTPAEIVRTLDRTIYRNSEQFALKNWAALFNITYREISARAWQSIYMQVGPLRFLVLRLLSLIGIQLKIPEAKPKSVPVRLPAKTSASEKKPDPARPGPATSHPKSKTPPPRSKAANSGPIAQQMSLIKILKEIKDIDQEIERSYNQWNPLQGDAAKEYRAKVDSICLESFAPRFLFASKTQEEGQEAALSFIAGNARLSAVPARAHKALARYLYLIALKHRLTSL